ncbi:unnamed protein product, partial [marine sediment metagenome]
MLFVSGKLILAAGGSIEKPSNFVIASGGNGR